jgi:hypothetical protein
MARTAVGASNVKGLQQVLKELREFNPDLLKELKSQELPPREEFRCDINGFRVYRMVLAGLPPWEGRITVGVLSAFNLVLMELCTKKIKGDAARVLLGAAARSSNHEISRIILVLSPILCEIADLVDVGFIRHDEKGWFFQGTKEEWDQAERKVYG